MTCEKLLQFATCWCCPPARGTLFTVRKIAPSRVGLVTTSTPAHIMYQAYDWQKPDKPDPHRGSGKFKYATDYEATIARREKNKLAKQRSRERKMQAAAVVVYEG